MGKLNVVKVSLRYGIDQIFGKKQIYPKKYNDGRLDITVIILPGYFAKRSHDMYGHLADKLSDEGYKVYFIPELGYNVKTVQDLAGIVNNFIDKNNLKNIVFFGHSKGGIIGKYFLKHFNEDGKVIGLIAFATPFGGIPFARNFVFRRFNELSSESKLIKELILYNKDNSKIYSIIPREDIFIKSDSDMKAGNENNVYLKAEGHYRAVNSPENIKLVLKILDEISRKISSS